MSAYDGRRDEGAIGVEGADPRAVDAVDAVDAVGDERRLRLAGRRRVLAGVAAGAVLLTGAGVAASSVIKSPAQAAADSGAPAPDVLTATVERRVLTDSVVIRGTVTAGQSVDVTPPTSGGTDTARSVVTKLPVRAGQSVRSGQVLVEVSGRPVFVLAGKLPAYRDLKPGSHGQDVAQVQEALRSLGHGTGGDAAGVFGAGTQAALAAFYAGLGYDPVPAEPDGAQQVTSAQTAVTQARRTWQDAKDALAAARQPASQGATASTLTVDQARKQVERAAEDLDTARSDLAAARAAAGPQLPASEVVFLRGFPARVDSVSVSVGATVSGKLMTVSAGALVVKGSLAPFQKGLVHPGQKVQILSEVDGVTANGTVASVSDTPNAAGGDGAQGDQSQTAGAGSYAVLVRPDRALDAGLAAQDVRLTVQAASSQGKVLVVPVSAVSAGADGKTVVTVYHGGQRRRVEVTLGTSGDGFTEIRPLAPGAVKEGDRVVVGVQEQSSDAGGQTRAADPAASGAAG